MRGRVLLFALSLAACGHDAISVDGGSDAPVDAPADAAAVPRPAVARVMVHLLRDVPLSPWLDNLPGPWYLPTRSGVIAQLGER